LNITKIHRYLAGEATLKERKEIEAWLETSEENRELFESYCKIYEVEIQNKYKYNIENALARFRDVMDKDHKDDITSLRSKKPANKVYQKKGSGVLWKIAAIILLTAGIGLYVYTSADHWMEDVLTEEVSGTLITTSPGEQKTFRLQDGSRIQLNSNSEILISEGFGKERRKIHLTGEAFFEVEQIPNLSFEVQTETAEIEVLGTSFGVRAWKNRDESVIAVKTGAVSVRSANHIIEEVEILEAGQISKVELNNPPTPAETVNIEQFIGWTQQLFVFDNTPLSDVLVQLENHFNVTITVKDSSSIHDPVTARYRNESLDEILKFTSITHGVSFKVENP
jgi:transmembrane sensor